VGGRQTPRRLVLGFSVLLLAGVIVATAALGLGVHTSYGSGIDSSLGNRIQHDFLADQEAEASALSKGDPSLISGYLTGNALQDVSQQISSGGGAGGPPTVSFQPGSLTILRAQDPIDPTLVVEVQEDATKTITTVTGPNSAPTEQTISFHGDFWMRKNASGRYLIADQKIQNLPSSNLGAIALSAVALVWVALAASLVVVRRRARAIPTPAAMGLSAAVSTVVDAAPGYEPEATSSETPPKVLVRTFGGLQVHSEGKDWAGALKARPVTAFVWLRLLVAVIRDPIVPPTREEVGRQASPGLDRETQLKRLRNVVYQGLRELPPALAERIVVEPQVMRFKLEDCEVDAINLLAVSSELAHRSLLSDPQVARALRVLDASTGVFLPEFESVENLATDHHPTCTALIADLRDLLTSKRVELAMLVANSLLATHRPDQAIALLERAVQERPERVDLRGRLAAAYRSVGRQEAATAIEPKSS
jgi:DNA-binding SARP family transcriptional activator